MEQEGPHIASPYEELDSDSNAIKTLALSLDSVSLSVCFVPFTIDQIFQHGGKHSHLRPLSFLSCFLHNRLNLVQDQKSQGHDRVSKVNNNVLYISK